MSWPMRQPPAGCLALRIPMRGYEIAIKINAVEDLFVTNPHEGL